MKLLHMADLHLGKTVNGMNFIEDQRHVLTQVLELMEKEPVDGLLLAGDIYDRSIPPEFPAIRLEDEYGPVCLHLLPYFKPAEARALFPEDEIRTHEDAMRSVLARHPVDRTERNVLVTHQFVTGTEPVRQSDSELLLSVGGTEQISYTVFEDYDYTALGHIHGPQKAGRETVRYSGSLLKYSFSEEFHKKSVTLVELKEKGNITLTVYPLRPRHDMRRIKGKLGDLLDPQVVEAADCEDYISAVLTDDEELADPMEKLRASYPNIMELNLEKKQRSGGGEVYADVREKTPLELGESFLKLTCGEAEEKRMEFLKKLLEEGGLNI